MWTFYSGYYKFTWQVCEHPQAHDICAVKIVYIDDFISAVFKYHWKKKNAILRKIKYHSVSPRMGGRFYFIQNSLHFRYDNLLKPNL